MRLIRLPSCAAIVATALMILPAVLLPASAVANGPPPPPIHAPNLHSFDRSTQRTVLAGKHGLSKVLHELERKWGKPGHLGLIALAVLAGLVLLAIRLAMVAVVVVVLIALAGSAGVVLPHIHLPF